MLRKPHGMANALFSIIILVLVLSYPFLVFRFIDDVDPSWFATILGIIVLVRFVVVSNNKQFNDWLMLIVVLVFCGAIALLESEQLLKFYPVLMSLGMAALFIISLKEKECLIERFAKYGGKTPPPEARNYLRSLTLLWGMLLLFNAAVSSYTAWYSSLKIWTLYNGLLSYLLLASFAVGEWFYRGYYKKKHNISDE